MKFELKFTTDYGQFYINDKNANGNTGSPGWRERHARAHIENKRHRNGYEHDARTS